MYYLPSCPAERKEHAFCIEQQEGKWLDPSVYAPAPEFVRGATSRKGRAAFGHTASKGSFHQGLSLTMEQLEVYGEIIDSYNGRADHHDIVTPHGWTYVGVQAREELWRRPGKNDEHSATFGYGGGRYFNVFTSSAPPLQDRCAYTLFDLRCVLDFGGDVAACARSLVKGTDIWRKRRHRLKRKQTNRLHPTMMMCLQSRLSTMSGIQIAKSRTCASGDCLPGTST